MSVSRRFDHGEAERRYLAGESVRALAAEYGVSYNAVWGAVTPRGQAWAKRCTEASTRWHRDHRQPCKGGCGRLVWVTTGTRTGLCPACLGLSRITAPCGTESAYSRGCRCNDCKRAVADARRRRRHADIEASRAYDRAYKNSQRAQVAA